MSRWRLHPDYQHLSGIFGSLQQVFDLQGERITHDPISEVICIEQAGVRYYVKRYRRAKGLRAYLPRPRIKAEWQNLQHFADWNIPTAKVVARGLERKNGAFVRGAMITVEIPDTQILLIWRTLLTRVCKMGEEGGEISQQVADFTAQA